MPGFEAFGVSDEGTSRMTIINPKTLKPYASSETGEEAWIEIAHMDGPDGDSFDQQVGAGRIVLKAKGRLDERDMAVTLKLAHLTKAWCLFGEAGEKIDLPCSVDNAARLYEQKWIRAQVFTHARNYANFSKASSAT